MYILQYLIAIPLAAAFATPLFAKRMKRTADMIACASTLALLIVSCAVAHLTVRHTTAAYNVGRWPVPMGITLFADSLSAFMLVVSNLAAFFIAVYSTAYIKTYTDKWKYYTLFMLMMAGVNGVLVTGDIFTLFIFLEIASISVYALVAFGTEPRSLEASFKYAVMSIVASSFVFLGIAFLYAFTSTLNMSEMAQALAISGQTKLLWFVSILFLMGFGLKSAAVPFHAWLPDAYSSSPATVPAISSGILIKSLGIYVLARIFFNVFGMTAAVSQVFVILAVLSMAVGGLLAFGQTNIRRMLGYSSISQIGYILLGLGVGTPLAIMGSIFHLFNHSIAKSSLFLNSGIIENSSQTNDLTKMSGIVSKRPACGYSSLLSALSVCGVPPLGGFWSKLMIIFACIQANRPVLAFVAASVAMLTIAYYFRAFTPVLFGKNSPDVPATREVRVGIAMNTAVIIMAIIVIAGGALLLPNVANTLLNNAAMVLVKGSFYANIGVAR